MRLGISVKADKILHKSTSSLTRPIEGEQTARMFLTAINFF